MQIVQDASLVAVAATYPCPAPHVVTVTDLHGDVDRPGLNLVPASHCSQLVFSVADPARNPWPCLHGKFEWGMHLAYMTPVLSWNCPVAQEKQPAFFVAVPLTCPIPGGHAVLVCTAHASSLAVTENVPSVQALHRAFSAPVPAILPSPMGQVTLVCLMQAPVPNTLKDPPGHLPHPASESLVPATNPNPASHE